MIHTSSGRRVLPGDFAAARTHGPVGAGIRLGEELVKKIEGWKLRNESADLDYEHAFTYLGDVDLGFAVPFYTPGKDLILEAEPGGAVIRPFHIDPHDCIWSTDNPQLALMPRRRYAVTAICWRMKGTPYSAADYFAIAARELKLHPLDLLLQDYVESSRHMICSQLVDFIRQQLDFKLFGDDRWNGLVDPMDIARVILEGPVAK